LLAAANVYYWRDTLWGDREETPPAPSAPEIDKKIPVVSYGTMGLTHSVREYGAGESGLNATSTGMCIDGVPVCVLGGWWLGRGGHETAAG